MAVISGQPAGARTTGAQRRPVRTVTNRAGLSNKNPAWFLTAQVGFTRLAPVKQTPGAMIRPGAVREFQFDEYSDLPG